MLVILRLLLRSWAIALDGSFNIATGLNLAVIDLYDIMSDILTVALVRRSIILLLLLLTVTMGTIVWVVNILQSIYDLPMSTIMLSLSSS